MKEEIWLSCKEKTCCYASLVTVTGRDVWRIARSLNTEPWNFLIYFTSAEPRPDAFLLDKSGRSYRLALAKGKTRRTKSPPPCMFLLKTRDGHHRCGLGALRPQVCRTFPIETTGGLLYVAPQTGCTCRQWSLADANLEHERSLQQERMLEYAEYCSLLERWNQGVSELPDQVQLDIYQFCQFIMHAYESAAREDEALEKVTEPA